VRLTDSSRLSLPLDNDGIGAQPSDFVDIADPADRAAFRNDDIPVFAGTESETYSFAGAIHQEIGPKLALRSEWDWSRVDSWQEQASRGAFFDVPASNAFNPFGEDVSVNYLPSFETANGLLPQDFDSTVSEIVNVNFGVDYAFSDRLRLSSTYIFSESSVDGSARRFLGNTSGSDAQVDFEARINATCSATALRRQISSLNSLQNLSTRMIKPVSSNSICTWRGSCSGSRPVQ